MTTLCSGWYNDAEYSDLTLKLSDGREIKVHKVIICKQNEYFRKLCEATSSFKEAKQNVITLEEDDAAAVEEVLRNLYGCVLPQAHDKPWRFWFTLVTAADKCLEPVLSESASSRLMEAAEMQNDSDTVFDIIQEIKASMSHHESLLGFAEQLRVKNLKDLLQNARYRAFLTSDPELMLVQLDELEVRRELSERAYFTCGQCESRLFHTPGVPHQGSCISCKSIHKTLYCRLAYLPKK